ncbi:MAG: hypothetical protein JXQ27_17015 [Acidobacteria bacterium]|nr:hypothetical protein [Acidobacteriota bacterium]
MTRRMTRSLTAAGLLIGIGALFLYRNLGGEMHVLTVIWYILILLLIFMGLQRIYRYVRTLGETDPETRVTRPSLAFALLWLAIGVLLLLSTLDIIQDPLTIFGQWWPALLILMGVAKLADALILPGQGRLRGVEVVGVIFLILMGITVDQLAQLQIGNIPVFIQAKRMFQDSYNFTRDESVDLTSVTALVFSHQNGRIQVNPAEGEVLQVTLQEEIFADSEADARRVEKQIQLNSRLEAGVMNISLTHPADETQAVAVRIRLAIPADIPVQIKNFHGDVSCDGLANPLEVSTTTGDITVKSHAGMVGATNSNGNIHLRDVQGDCEISGRNAEIIVRNLQGTLKIDQRRGSAIVEELKGNSLYKISHGELRATGVEGQMEIDAPQTPVRLRDVVGNATVSSTYETIEVIRLNGDLAVTARSSGIDLEDIAGMVSGTAERGRLTAENLRQGIRMNLTRCRCNLQDITGPIEITNSGKDVIFRNIRGAVVAKNDRGSLTFRGITVPDLTRLHAVTEGGDVAIYLNEFPENRKLFLAVESGFFSSEFPMDELTQDTLEGGMIWRNFAGGHDAADWSVQVKHGKILLKKISEKSTEKGSERNDE